KDRGEPSISVGAQKRCGSGLESLPPRLETRDMPHRPPLRPRRLRLARGSAWALAAALLAPLAPLACAPRSRVEPLPRGSNILLLTVDTLRADHLSSYGYSRQTSPVLDRLGAAGVRFGEAVVQWPKTTPSF